MRDNRVSQANWLLEASETGEKVEKGVTAIVESAARFRAREQKIIRSAISLIGPDDKEFKTLVVPVHELLNSVNITDRKIYKELDDICTRLFSNTISINLPDGPLKTSWFYRAQYFKSRSCVEFDLSPALKPFLLNIKDVQGGFTSYRLGTIAGLVGRYSVRLYEILRRALPENEVKNGRKTVGFRKIKVEKLRSILGVPEERYTLFSSFRRDVLEKSKKELLEKTDLHFDFKTEKMGKRVSHIVFTVKANGVIGTDNQEQEEKQETPLETVERMQKAGATPEELLAVMQKLLAANKDPEAPVEVEVEEPLIIPADFCEFDERQIYRIRELIPTMPVDIIFEDIEWYGTAIYAEAITQYQFGLNNPKQQIKNPIKYFRGILKNKIKEQLEHQKAEEKNTEWRNRTMEEKLRDTSWGDRS